MKTTPLDALSCVITLLLSGAILQSSVLSQSIGINTESPLTILDVRGTNDISDGGTLQLSTPNETNYLRFFGGRLGDRNPFIAFHDSDTLHFVSTLPDYSTYARHISILSNGKVGVGTDRPTQMLEVAGPVRVGADVGDMPTAGTIRWNDEKNDFEGYTGSTWVSLTGSSGPSGSSVVTDIDGNAYLTVTIGSQTWMRENLRTTRYRNGDPIPEVLLDNDWAGLNSGAWSWYDHNPENERPYGKLYNWFAVIDTSGLCPTGWHIPTDAEWTTLTDFLGGAAVAGGRMKTTGTIQAGTGYWEDPNTSATNESGFTGLPAGFRGFSGFFDATGSKAYWWSSTQWNTDRAYMRFLSSTSSLVERINTDKNLGFTVRCVSD